MATVFPALSTWIQEDLTNSGLSVETISAMCIEEVPKGPKGTARLKEVLGFARLAEQGILQTTDAYIIHYPENGFARVKLRYPIDGAKYLSPKKDATATAFHLYYLPSEHVKLTKPTYALVVTEGEKKAAKLTQDLQCHLNGQNKATVVGLPGVTMWHGCPEWKGVRLSGREVFLCFDADFQQNADVEQQLLSLYLWLRKKKANVKVMTFDQGKGIDDYLVIKAKDGCQMPEVVTGLFAAAQQNIFDILPHLNAYRLADAAVAAFYSLKEDCKLLWDEFKLGKLLSLKFPTFQRLVSKAYQQRNSLAKAKAQEATAMPDQVHQQNQPAEGDQQPLPPVEEIEHFSDMGNARRFIKAHGHNLRYCYEWNAWLIWDGRCWQLDKTGEIFRLAKQAVKGIYGEAATLNGEGQRKEAAKHALRSEARIRVEAMIALARSEPNIPILTEQLDQDPWKLNVLNGTIDLKTGRLLPHNKADLITKLIAIEYDLNAKCDLWRNFLNKIMAGNHNLISFLQRTVGYSLTGDVSEQVLFFLYGTGANGKSKFLEASLGIIGQFAMQAAPDILMMKQYESHPTGLADLFGKRFVACVETEEGKRLAESLVKQMTGGDRMKARFMRQDFFEFAPTFKIWLAANHKPVIRGNDYAIWRRIRMIPFTVTIPAKEQDKRLGDKLKAEYAGILRWAVEGCLAWQREGLKEPEEVVAATKNYQEEMDVFGRFLREETVQDPVFSTQASVLYTRYKTWCEINGENAMTGNALGRRMTELGFPKERSKRGYIYKNIGLSQKEE